MAGLRLTARDRETLGHSARHAADAREARRALALLDLDAGESPTRGAQRYRVSRSAVYEWAARWGDADRPRRERLRDADRSGRPPEVRDAVEAALADLVPADPRDHGYRHPAWATRLLLAYLARSGVAASDATVRRALHRLGYRWKRPRLVLSRRAEHWRQARGAEAGAGVPQADGRPVHRRRHPDRDAAAAGGLVAGRGAGRGPDCREPGQGGPGRGTEPGHRGAVAGRGGDVEPAHVPGPPAERPVGVAGWHLVLFLDRGSPHTAGAARELAAELGLELRFLPTACPEVNPVEGRWRHAKGRGPANEPAPNLGDSLGRGCDELFTMAPTERRKLAGVLSENFWLST